MMAHPRGSAADQWWGRGQTPCHLPATVTHDSLSYCKRDWLVLIAYQAPGAVVRKLCLFELHVDPRARGGGEPGPTRWGGLP